MIISDKIFARMKEISMTQKEFCELTGIQQSTVSGWKKNHTNPTSEKILPICRVLKITPEWLLSDSDEETGADLELSFYLIDKNSDDGKMVFRFRNLSRDNKMRVIGYMDALESLEK